MKSLGRTASFPVPGDICSALRRWPLRLGPERKGRIEGHSSEQPKTLNKTVCVAAPRSPSVFVLTLELSPMKNSAAKFLSRHRSITGGPGDLNLRGFWFWAPRRFTCPRLSSYHLLGLWNAFRVCMLGADSSLFLSSSRKVRYWYGPSRQVRRHGRARCFTFNSYRLLTWKTVPYPPISTTMVLTYPTAST